MPKHKILKFPLPSTSLDPLEVSARQEEQIWCLNIKSIELKSPVFTLCKMSSGHMDLCTFLVSGTLIEQLLIANTPLFSAL